MKQIQKDGLLYFTFSHMEKTGLVRHAFTSRHGGVSEGCYEALNLSLQKGEPRAHTMENYRRICRAISVREETLVMSAGQVHGVCVAEVTEEDGGKGILFPSDFVGVDGFVTDRPEVCLVTFHADCVPLFFLDPVHRAIGLSHAGWRGTIQGMAVKMVEKMEECFKSRPEELLVGIGPSIGVCCFQVDTPVAEAARESLSFADEYLFLEQGDTGHYKMDLWGINKRLLMEAGVLEKQIEMTDWCTMCHPDLFYSHRVMGDARGNMAGMICLQKND